MRMKETADVVWLIICEMPKRYLLSRCQECKFTAKAVEPIGQGPQRIKFASALLSSGTHS